MKKIVRAFLKVLVVIVFTVVLYDFSKSVIKLLQLQNEQKQLEVEYQTLLLEQENLERELGLTDDPEYLKMYAKENFLFSEGDSHIISIVDDEE